MKKYTQAMLVLCLLFIGGLKASAIETYDFQELCMQLGKGGPWAVNDGEDAGFTINEATMHYLGNYENFDWNNRFAYEFVDGRGKFTMRNKSNKKDGNCGMFSWDYAHYFSILGLKNGDKVTITVGAGTVNFVSTNVEEGVSENDAVVSNQVYTITTTDETTRLDLQMQKATLIAKIVIQPYGEEVVPTITVSPKALTLMPGATGKLTATIEPTSCTGQWVSDNEEVATVAEDGTVTAVAPGTANISCQWTEDATKASATAVITVSDVKTALYSVAKSFDFTAMGDIALTTEAEAAGEIWNAANSKNNKVFFCTNEGMENIAIQAALSGNKGWSVVDGKGLYEGSGAGRCAAVAGIKKDQIVEFIYTGANFYTSKEDSGIDKTVLSEGQGRAIYMANADGMIGFELDKGNYIEQINIYGLNVEPGTYYIYNPATQKYLAAGDSWGTRALVNEDGLDISVALKDGKYTLDTQVTNGGDSHFLGDNCYVDAPAYEWTIQKADDGNLTIGNGTNYLTVAENGLIELAGDATSERAHWQFRTLVDRLADLVAATPEHGVDATFLIRDANFNRNDLRRSAWTMSEDCHNQNLSGGNNTNNNAESYHSTFTLSQNVKYAPRGNYKMSVQGFYRQDDDVTEPVPVFFANGVTAEIPAKTGSENSMSDASNSFTNGLYTIEPMSINLPIGKDLVVGVRNETAEHQWVIFDNFRLMYYGTSDSDLMKEAIDLAGTPGAIAAGKLIEVIHAAQESGDESTLPAAIAQFKSDNADLEKDMTAQVKTDGAGWKKFEGNEAAGVCATQFAPAITTYDGRTVNLMENYETTAETTGQIIYQNISGLDNGKYKVGFYANAFFTSGRGFESDMADGAEDVAYVFANEKKEFITAKIATATTENNFRQFEVEVTDGNIKLGLGKEKPGTNWHTIQIYQLTWSTTAQAAYAKDKATMEALINQAAALENDPEKENGKAELGAAIYAAQAAMKSNRLNIPEFEAEIGKLQTAIEDFDAANRITFSGVYYVQSVANGKYLSAGHSWGTQAIVDADGLDLTLAVEEGNKVSFDTQVSNGGDSHFLGSNCYTDAGKFGWIIAKTEGGYSISDGTLFLGINENDELVLGAEAAAWQFVSAEERFAALAEATKDNGVDATFLIKDANFGRNNLRQSAWTVSEDCTNKNLSGGNNTNNCAESFHSVFTISQLVENAPKGTYALTAQGFYRQDGEEAEATPIFFINQTVADVPLKTGEENSMSAASESFTQGLYAIEPIKAYVAEGETLTIGVKNETALNQWIIFDNFRLTYYGEENSTEASANGQTTGIQDIRTAQSLNSIYTMQGQKVGKAQKGLYIVDGKKMIVR